MSSLSIVGANKTGVRRTTITQTVIDYFLMLGSSPAALAPSSMGVLKRFPSEAGRDGALIPRLEALADAAGDLVTLPISSFLSRRTGKERVQRRPRPFVLRGHVKARLGREGDNFESAALINSSMRLRRAQDKSDGKGRRKWEISKQKREMSSTSAKALQ